MKSIEEAAKEYGLNYGTHLPPHMTLGHVSLNIAFKDGVAFSQKWIPVEEELPEYEQSVLVKRPNRYSGKTDILMAILHKAKEEGTEYGGGYGMGCVYQKTFKDYWSLPAIVLLETITHWRPIELK